MIREKPLLYTLAFVQFTNIMDFMIMMPLSKLFMKEFHIGEQQFSWLVSSYTITAGIVCLLGSFFLDRFDRRRALLVAYAGFVVGTFACGLAHTFGLLLAARVLTGVFGGVLAAIVLSIVGDAVPLQRRASAMGIVMAGFSGAAALGVPTGNLVASSFTWNAPFFGIAGLGFIAWFFVVKFVPPMRGHLERAEKEKPGAAIVGAFRNINQLRALLLMLLLMLGQFTVIPFITPYLIDNVGFTQQQITLVYFCGGCCSIFTAPRVGKLADRYGRNKVFTIMVLCSLVSIFLMTNLPAVPLAVALIVTSSFFIFVPGRGIPAQTIVTSTVEPKQRGGFMSLNSSVMQLGAGIAALLSGVMVVHPKTGPIEHYNWVGYVAICSSLLCLIVVRLIKPIPDQPAVVQAPAEPVAIEEAF